MTSWQGDQTIALPLSRSNRGKRRRVYVVHALSGIEPRDFSVGTV